MEFLKKFSAEYANGISAIAALATLVLAITTLWFLKREYTNKYRPYFFPDVKLDPVLNSAGFNISIVPRNIGPHPFEFMLHDVSLHIGDETYGTPDFKEWMLLPPQGLEIRYPAGYVNDQGIQRIREGRYRKNRIELNFKIKTRSTEKKMEKVQSAAFEINVLGEVPFASSRPDWIV